MEELKNIKIGLIGDIEIGKSCLVNYISNGAFIEQYIPTIGVDLRVLYLDNLRLKFTFWDLSGQSIFNDLVDNFVNSLNVICFCFSFDNIDSYNYMIQKYTQYHKNDTLRDKSCLVLQLKSDNNKEELDICKKFCNDNNIKFFTISSLKQYGKEEFIIHLIKLFYKDNNEYKDVDKHQDKYNCIIN
jgi:small GTP-binding protein